MTNFKLLFIFFSLFQQVICQTCQEHVENVPTIEVILKSPVVVEAIAESFTGKSKAQNVTAEVSKIFPSRNGNLKVGSKIKFGPVGKMKNCAKLKLKKKYILFLNESINDHFYWVTYNPMKSKKKPMRLLRKKLLCRKCLIPASFSKPVKKIHKEIGESLKISCKAKGYPRPKLSLHYNGRLLTPENTSKNMELKFGKKGDSVAIKIKKLKLSHNNDAFICSATNAASKSLANYTINVMVEEHICKTTCSLPNVNYCQNGCCEEKYPGIPICTCNDNWKGERCDEIDFKTVLAINRKDNSDHQKHVIAILGLCLSLMMVLFICFSVYCIFKNKRYKKINSNISLISKEKQHIIPDCNEITEESSQLDAGQDNLFLDGANMQETNLNDVDEMGYNHSYTHVNLNSNFRNSLSPNYKRSRLNGIAKNDSLTSAKS